ncbi:MBL fold metallo-hydrolase [candidate division WOR-3 bacterium]|nr:MBL fold metallo-hydrolase [candidate division WOR-3 bacterium]
MDIEFYGATREVTGSKFILIAEGVRVLMECGLYQGRRKESEKKNRVFPFDPEEFDFMILSHAHIDHSGNIPNLVKQGFTSDIFATTATVDLLKYMLIDSGHIHERDAEWINKKIKKRGEELIEPLYTVGDAEESLTYFKPLYYHDEENRSINFKFLDAGHILGSAEVLIQAEGKRVLFTGDLGRNNLPIIRDPEVPDDIDVLIMESTYGNRLHRDIKDAEKDLEEIIKRTIRRKGKIIIPSFAVERAQEVIYSINSLIIQERIPDIPIYVDSPLTVDVTQVFLNHPEYFDEEAYKMLRENHIFNYGKINYIKSVEQSKALNNKEEPMIVISASGMCEHGRILHHLKNSIGDERNTILIVGFQAKNTLGRRLVDGKKEVNIFGEPYKRRAQVVELDELSAHADRNDLIKFAKSVDPERIFLVHGEEEQIESLGEALKGLGYKVYIPEFGSHYRI